MIGPALVASEGEQLLFRGGGSIGLLAALLVLGAVLVAWLYARESGLTAGRRIFLALLRVAIVWLLLVLLFQPVARTEREAVIPGNLLVMLDVSESMDVHDRRQRDDDIRSAAFALGAPAAAAAGGDGGGADSPGGSDSPGGVELDPQARRAAVSASRIELARGLLARGDIEVFSDVDERRRVRFFRFAERLEPVKGAGEGLRETLLAAQPKGAETRLGDALREAVDRHLGQRVEGIIVLTDGGSNAGIDPEEVARELGARSIPVFAVGLGLPRPDDARVEAVVVPDTVFAGDRVPVQVQVASEGYSGRSADLVLSLDGREVAREKVDLEDGSRFVELSFVPRAGEGARELQVTLASQEQETSVENNRARRTLRVIDEKIRVLYVEGRPRWEYRYLRAVLLRDPRLEVRFLLSEGDPDLARASPRYVAAFPDRREDFSRYDLVILGDVPAYFFTRDQLEWIERLVREDGGSFLSLAGPEHTPMSYRSTVLEPLFPVRLVEGSPLEVHSSVHPVPESGERSGQEIVRLDAAAARSARLWSLVRPLYRVPRLAGVRPGATRLVILSSGAGGGEYPLVAWQRYGTGKSLFVGTDQLWRLRYRQGDRYHAAFWGRAIRFLTLSRLLGENKRVRVETERASYRSGERIEVHVNALNQSFDPIESSSYTVRVDASQRPDPIALRLTAVPGVAGLYEGAFTPDREGRYVIRAASEDEAESSPATFDVTPFRRERLEPDMQEEALRRLAALSGGDFLRPEELPSLAERLPPQRRTMPVREERELWDRPAFLVALIALAGLEWLLRRRYDLA